MRRSASPWPQATSSSEKDCQPRGLARQPRQHRPMRQRDGIDARQIAQAAPIVVVVDAIGVHPLVGGAARGEAHGRWNAKVSTVRPGPNAIAMPSPAGVRRTQDAIQHEHQRRRRHVAEVAQHVARVAQRIRRQRQPMLHGVQDRTAAGMHRPQRDVGTVRLPSSAGAVLAQPAANAARAPDPTDASQIPDRRCAR